MLRQKPSSTSCWPPTRTRWSCGVGLGAGGLTGARAAGWGRWRSRRSAVAGGWRRGPEAGPAPRRGRGRRLGGMGARCGCGCRGPGRPGGVDRMGPPDGRSGWLGNSPGPGRYVPARESAGRRPGGEPRTQPVAPSVEDKPGSGTASDSAFHSAGLHFKL